MPGPITVYDLYGDFWSQPRLGFDEKLNQSLNPRDPDTLDELFGTLGIAPSDTIMDIGCRDALHAVEFTQRWGCHAIAIDPIAVHMDWARQRIAEAGMQDHITLIQGRIEELPGHDNSIDHIWCRDVLTLVDLPRGLAECFRVLKPGSTMLTFQTFATPLLEPEEARRFFAASAKVPDNTSCAYFERTAQSAGLDMIHKEVIGSEWRENGLENGWGSLDKTLLRLSRMRRLEDRLVQEYGRDFYEATYAGDLVNVYQVLGKLCPIIHILRKPV